MLFSPLSMRVALAAGVLLPAVAQADVTADDVWSDWRSYMAGVGYEITGSEAQSGNVLTISNVVLNMNLGETEGDATLQLGTITLTENNDGTVGIDLPEVMPLQFQSRIEGEDAVTFSMEMDYTQTGLVMTASGNPDAMRYDYSAGAMGLVLKNMIVDDKETIPDDMQMAFSLQDITGRNDMTVGALRSYKQVLDAASATYRMSFKEPDGDVTMNLDGESSKLRYEVSGDLPLDLVAPGDMNEMLAAGFNVDGAFTFGPGAMQLNFSDPQGENKIDTTSQGGTVDMKMSRDGMTYEIEQNNLAVNVASFQAPLPISFKIETTGAKITMPVQKSDDPEDYALALNLKNFTMAEQLWSIFDPSAQLPRDPATIVLDLTGKARLLIDFLDPSAAALSDNLTIAPAEIDTVSINRLQVSAAGAELKGEGAFEFDNSAPVGPPQPVGAADLTLVGGNKLIDTLVTMGLLPEDQAMGARMMMGLLAVPGKTPDTLNSKIEINEQGHILANGQRIQ